MNFSLLSYEMPEVGGTKYGCFAKIPYHDKEYHQNSYSTSYKDSFCKKFDDNNYMPTTGQMFQHNNIWSGVSSEYEMVERKKITSKLLSESYNRDPERKYNTEIQRTWINHRDPAIKGVEDQKIDNASQRPQTQEIKLLTLPMQNREEYLDFHKKVYGNCGHKISDITRKKLEEMAKLKKQKEGVA